ncbi:hypothetical protein L6R50_14635 [Myxococcota bacterium]|nr:hypothetical protein [Myxococcota bacterium]
MRDWPWLGILGCPRSDLGLLLGGLGAETSRKEGAWLWAERGLTLFFSGEGSFGATADLLRGMGFGGPPAGATLQRVVIRFPAPTEDEPRWQGKRPLGLPERPALADLRAALGEPTDIEDWSLGSRLARWSVPSQGARVEASIVKSGGGDRVTRLEMTREGDARPRCPGDG